MLLPASFYRSDGVFEEGRRFLLETARIFVWTTSYLSRLGLLDYYFLACIKLKTIESIQQPCSRQPLKHQRM